MAITYPLDFPGYQYVEAVSFSHSSAVGISQSPYTGQQQVYDYQSGFWTVDISLRWMNREEAAPVIAFVEKLRGQFGTFTFGDNYISNLPLGVATGTPLVKGANQKGFSLNTDGWTSSVTNILKAGDWFQIGNSLYRNLNDVNSDGSGNATLDIFPQLKPHADNAAIIVTSPKGIFRLNASSQRSMGIDRQKQVLISISAQEAL